MASRSTRTASRPPGDGVPGPSTALGHASAPGTRWRYGALGCLLAVCLAVAACGEEGPADPTAEGAPPVDAGWSTPGDPSELPAGAVTSTEDVVGELAMRLASGEGITGEGWQTDVRRVAEALWPVAPGASVPEAARVHIQLTHIARDVAEALRGGPPARAAVAAERPLELKIHDRMRAALERGPESYADWCAEQGAKLFVRFREQRIAQISGG